MRTPLEQRVLASIRQSRMLTAGDRVGVAVSGGADSVALLRILESLRAELGITLLVVHFDHCLRGAESEADARFVNDLANANGLEFVLAREDVAAAASQHGWNLEDAGRRLRYACFQKLVDEGRATRIAVGHTADDQAETVLAHLVRGTGLSGLAGIFPCTGPIVRPLLEFRRRELREYLEARSESWHEDSSNRDTERLRARIRRQMLPVLERDFSPAIVDHLCDLSRFARDEESFWGAIVENCFHARVQRAKDSLTIGINDLMSPLGPLALPAQLQANAASEKPAEPPASRALTARLIRRLYEGLRGDHRDLEAGHVEALIHLATECTSGKRVELPGGIMAERVFDEIVFSHRPRANLEGAARETNAAENTYQYEVKVPERGATVVTVPELGTSFRLKVIDWASVARETIRDQAVLDAALLRAPVILRNWRPGDAYRASGRRQPRKLKEMFLAKRIPSRERAKWPVMESGGRVIWARGMPAADDYCAREGTQRGLVIEEDGA
jgi:tRNA(Ile)-lysidine synthase